MRRLRDGVIKIASPDVPLGCIGISDTYKEQGVQAGELVPFEVDNMKRLRIMWVSPDEEEKATALAGTKWVCLNEHSGVTFDYHIEDKPEVKDDLPQPINTIQADPMDLKLARDYLEERLGGELLKDFDIEIFRVGNNTKARIYYKVWASGVKSGKTIQEAIDESLQSGLYNELVATRGRIDETIDKLGNN